jgi:hypothetical protein
LLSISSPSLATYTERLDAKELFCRNSFFYTSKTSTFFLFVSFLSL